MPSLDSFKSRRELQVGSKTYVYYDLKAAEENGLGYNLVAGANIAGFAKVADAMLQQGTI